MMDESFDLRFLAPFTLQCIGATSCGKSWFTRRLIENKDVMIHPPPDFVLYCYSEWQSMFEEMQDVTFNKGLTEDVISREALNGRSCLLVIDDLADEVCPKLLSAIFTKLAHHRQLSTLFLCQNLYYRGLKCMRDINLNSHYSVLYKQPRDKSSICTLARQIFPDNYQYLIDSYMDATQEPYSYLLIDSKPTTPDKIRLRSKIFPGEDTVVYQPKKKKYASS